MRGSNYCLVFFLLILSGFSNASTITFWSPSFGSNTTFRGESAISACLAAGGNSVRNYTNESQPFDGVGDRAACYYPYGYLGYVSKSTLTCAFGNTGLTCNASCDAPNTMVNGQCVMPSCPVGQKRNAGGQCEAFTCTQDSSGSPIVYSPKQDKCTKYYNLDSEEMCSHLGQSKTPTATSVEVVTADPDGLTQTTDKALSCGLDVTNKQCTNRVDGFHKCRVDGTYNGQFNPNGEDNLDNCPTQDCSTKPPETPKPEVPKPETSTDSKPCNYTSVNGALECVSSSIENKEGTKNCGTVNGVWQCLKTAPTSNGISILTKVKTEPTPDGGTKTTKTDTATQTKCTDIGKCTTNTTTNVNVTIKDGQGNVTSTTGTCKGDNCPDKNGNPDANGDGFGDCVGDDCGGGSGGPSNAELEEVPTFGQTTQSLINRVKSSSVAQSLTGITVPSSGVCPTYSAETYIGTVEYESHCEIVEPKRDLIKVIMRAVWAFVAILFFFGG